MIKKLAITAFATAMTLSVAGTVHAAGEAKPKKEPTAAQLAARERMKTCSAEWKEAKAAKKIEAGMKWPKFWSACNTRLKGGAKA